MILKSCYIESFGKLKEFRYDFRSGVNSIVEKNGWGKTTFAAFIKAMLYGFPQTKKSNPFENERKHYLPWFGGRFGGSLTFSARGKTYVAVRYFGEKESSDYFKLYDTATEKETKDFSENLGYELFSVDADSYMKSAFIGSYEEDRFGKSPSVRERLTKGLETAEDAVSFERAIEILEKQRKVYKLSGNKGKIGDLETELETLKLSIAASERDRVEAERMEKATADLSDAILAIAKKEEVNAQARVAARQKEADIALRRQYDRLLSEKKNAEEKKEALYRSLNSAPPTDEWFALRANDLERLQETRILALSERLSEADEERRRRILEAFDGVPPTKEIILRKARDEAAVQLKEYREKTAKREAKISEGKKARTKRFLLLLIPAILLLAAFGALLSFLLPLALSSFAVGTLLLIGAIVTRLCPLKIEDDALLPPEAIPDEDLLFALREYERINEAETATKNRRDALLLEHKEREEAIFTALLPYGEQEGSAAERIADVKRRCEQYAEAVAAVEDAEKRLSEYIADHPEAKNALTETATLSDSLTLDEERRLLASEKLKLTEERDRLARLVLPLRANADRADERRHRATVVSEELDEAKQRFFAIESAKKYLEEARDRLSTRYLSDMQAAFTRYISRLVPDFDSRGILSADLSLKVENGGRRYDPAYFSDGTRDALSLAVHLALHDALFEDEKPVLILDDTFASLDKDTLERAKNLLSELSSSVQIIYFTCHESRDVK